MAARFGEAAAALSAAVSPSKVAHVVAVTLKKRPILPRLLGLLHPILERNVDGKTLLAFKAGLLELTTNSASLFEKSLNLTPGAGVRLTLWMHALTIGLAQIAAPAPAVKGLIQTDNSLSAFQIDFLKEIESAIGALFDGIAVQQNRKNSSRKR
jgi:Tetracyclin repressor-like, C-terminal domain